MAAIRSTATSEATTPTEALFCHLTRATFKNFKGLPSKSAAYVEGVDAKFVLS